MITSGNLRMMVKEDFSLSGNVFNILQVDKKINVKELIDV